MSKLEKSRHISLETITIKEERVMAAFSDYLTAIKNKRNFTVAQVAKICGIDRTVLFRWCNGTSLPESWERLEPLLKKLRLTGEENRQIKAAFEREQIGFKQSICFAEIKSVLRLLEEQVGQTKNLNQELYQNIHIDYHMPEFLVLHSQMDLLQCARNVLQNLPKKNNLVLYLKVKSIPEILLILLQQFCKAANQGRIEIIIGIEDYSYRSEAEKLRLLYTLLELQLQGSNKIVWRCLKDIDIQAGQGWILTDQYYIQFPEDMKFGIMTGNKEWFRFFSGMSKRLCQSGELLLKNCCAAEADYIDRASPDYIMAHQPKEDDMTEDAVVFFSEKGLADCGTDRLHEILRNLMQEERRWILLKNTNISLEHICMKLFDGQKGCLKIDLYPDADEQRQIIVKDRQIVNQFKRFLEYIADTDWVYTEEEAIGIVGRMLDK